MLREYRRRSEELGDRPGIANAVGMRNDALIQQAMFGQTMLNWATPTQVLAMPPSPDGPGWPRHIALEGVDMLVLDSPVDAQQQDLAVLSEWVRRQPSLGVMQLTDDNDPSFLLQAMRAGVRACAHVRSTRKQHIPRTCRPHGHYRSCMRTCTHARTRAHTRSNYLYIYLLIYLSIYLSITLSLFDCVSASFSFISL